MSRNTATYNFSGNFNVQKAAPIDNRALLDTYEDLTKTETWTNSDNSYYTYVGMIVACKDRPGKLFQLIGEDYTQKSNWKTIGTDDGDLITKNTLTFNTAILNTPSDLATEYVDFGLPSGTLWAKYNLGATSETDAGVFFQWGSVVGYRGNENIKSHSQWSTCPGNGNSSSEDTTTLTTWNTNYLNNNKLSTSVDAAYIYTDGIATMPTRAQFRELCNYTQYELNDKGTYMTFKKYGNSDIYIILPLAPIYDESGAYPGDLCQYWSNELVGTDSPTKAYYITLREDSPSFTADGLLRCHSLPIRGVTTKSALIRQIALPEKSGTLALQSDVDTLSAKLKAVITALNLNV